MRLAVCLLLALLPVSASAQELEPGAYWPLPRSANASVMVPVVGGHVEGLYLGEFAEVGRFGLGDPRLKLAVNLLGAPVMTAKEFASYQQRGIVGVSLTVAPPLGQYDPAKIINLGTNRWSFKPELGLSRTNANGKWVIEMMAGVWLFTDNTEFVGGRTREQDPIITTQVHVTYKFNRRMWLAGDAGGFHLDRRGLQLRVVTLNRRSEDQEIKRFGKSNS